MYAQFEQRTIKKKKAGLKDCGLLHLSTAVISNEERYVLNHGLKFFPPRLLNKLETFIDIHKFVRKINIKKYLITNHFRSNKSCPSEIRNTSLANASVFNLPGNLAPSVSIFRDLVTKYLEQLQIHRNRSDHIFKKGVDLLKQCRDIVVRAMDKGGGRGIVILDSET